MPQPEASSPTRVKSKAKFPWLALALLLGSIYLFWVLPHQLPDQPVQVEFETPNAK